MADSKELLIEQLSSNLEILRAGAKLTQEATAKAIGNIKADILSN